jgi:hypothetical protein
LTSAFGTETFTLQAKRVWYRSDVASIMLDYTPISVTVALGPLILHRPPAQPAPPVLARPRFTG